jgi:hypothetical protein
MNWMWGIAVQDLQREGTGRALVLAMNMEEKETDLARPGQNCRVPSSFSALARANTRAAIKKKNTRFIRSARASSRPSRPRASPPRPLLAAARVVAAAFSASPCVIKTVALRRRSTWSWRDAALEELEDGRPQGWKVGEPSVPHPFPSHIILGSNATVGKQPGQRPRRLRVSASGSRTAATVGHALLEKGGLETEEAQFSARKHRWFGARCCRGWGVYRGRQLGTGARRRRGWGCFGWLIGREAAASRRSQDRKGAQEGLFDTYYAKIAALQ